MAPTKSTAEEAARRRSLRAAAERIGHRFGDLAHLDRALTHASTGNEGKPNYERLEFLGDAFLGFAVADELYRRTPEIPEGKLTETRAGLVSRRPLAEIARSLDLVRCLDVGKGLKDADLHSERILADLTEAVLGAIYLDGGVRAGRRFVRRHILPRLARLPETDEAPVRDDKSRLLHFCQRHKLGQPRYRLVETRGKQHEQEFFVTVSVPEGHESSGRGRTKREAEKMAAGRLLAILKEWLADHRAEE